MPLKKVIKSLEEVAEPFRELYVKDEKSGSYRLDLDSDDSPSPADDGRDRIAEFRNRNIEQAKEIERLKSQLDKFKDFDPDKYRKAQDALQKLEAEEERKLLQEGKIDELISRRTAVMRSDYERQIKALAEARQNVEKERDTFRDQLAVFTIDNTVEAELARVGKLRPKARKDALARARGTFRVGPDGNLVPDASGQVLYGKDGEPLKPAEWAQQLLEDAPHLFEPGGGGGSQGGDEPPAGGPKVRRLRNSSDPLEFGQNLEAIAKGEMEAPIQ